MAPRETIARRRYRARSSVDSGSAAAEEEVAPTQGAGWGVRAEAPWLSLPRSPTEGSASLTQLEQRPQRRHRGQARRPMVFEFQNGGEQRATMVLPQPFIMAGDELEDPAGNPTARFRRGGSPSGKRLTSQEAHVV